MNLWWEVFAVDDTALGGWLPDDARLATVVIADCRGQKSRAAGLIPGSV
jgi:hypothetical protein